MWYWGAILAAFVFTLWGFYVAACQEDAKERAVQKSSDQNETILKSQATIEALTKENNRLQKTTSYFLDHNEIITTGRDPTKLKK